MQLKELMTNAGLNQTDVALKLNIKQQTVSKWCNRKSTPTIVMMKKLAELLNVSTQNIVDCFIDKKEE